MILCETEILDRLCKILRGVNNMISYINGVVDSIENDKLVLDNNGIGYGIFMPITALENIGIGEELKVFTYFNVREDAMQLFGFLTREELNIFRLLIGVSGVGPKGGMSIISSCPGNNIQMAILSGDSKAISKAPGIGNKTAQKIIIELKDKLDFEEMISDIGIDVTDEISTVQSDTIDALISLGYSRTDAFNSIKKIKGAKDMDVETLLKAALKAMI